MGRRAAQHRPDLSQLSDRNFTPVLFPISRFSFLRGLVPPFSGFFLYRAQSLAKQLRKFGYNVQITPANRAPA
jgi:hypothetical protein